MLREWTEGNPFSAGLIAFGVGWLASTLIPTTQVEQRAARHVEDKAEPLAERARDQLSEAATQVKDKLQPRAEETTQSLKDSAASAIGAVQDQDRESGQRAADDADTVEILRFPGAVDTGRFPKPRPFGGMGKPVDEDGFSDHFPIGVRVTEAD